MDLHKRARDLRDLFRSVESDVGLFTTVVSCAVNGGKAGVRTEASAMNAAELLLDGKALLLTSKYPCHLRTIQQWCDYDRSIERRVHHGGFMGHTCDPISRLARLDKPSTLLGGSQSQCASPTDIGQFHTGLTPAQIERFAILSEELGEAQQVIGKILRHGLISRHPKLETTNRTLLANEIGDVLYAIDLLVSAKDIYKPVIEASKAAKAVSIAQYLHHQ